MNQILTKTVALMQWEFMDCSNQKYHDIFQLLSTCFPEHIIPSAIQVRHVDDAYSGFNVRPNQVPVIEISKLTQCYLAVIAHELTHVCLIKINPNLSSDDHLRFLDEGIANLMEKKVDDRYKTQHKDFCQRYAAMRHKERPLRISFLQNWKIAFGTKHNGLDWMVYHIASNFVYHLLKLKPWSTLLNFLEGDLSAPNFEATFQRHYALEVTQFESIWHDSLERTASIAMAPICEFSPPNGAKNVSPGVQKLTITFNTMMNPYPIIICKQLPKLFQHVVWHSYKEMAVLVILEPGKDYFIHLGRQDKGHMKSIDGLELPCMTWSFSTT